jgi:ABC-type sugar transport system, periplasmic component
MFKLRLLSLLLVIIILFSACKQQSPEIVTNTNTPVNAYKTQSYTLPAEFHPNHENNYRRQIIHYRDGLVYILGKDYEWKSVMLVYNPELETSYEEPLTPYNDGASIEFLEYCSDDSVVTVETTESAVKLNKMSADGEKLFSIDLSEQTQKLLIGKDDTIYIANNYFVTAVSADGKMLYDIPLNDYEYMNLDMFDNGDVFVAMVDAKARRTIYKYIDADRKAFGDDVELTSGLAQYSETIIHSGGGYDIYYQTPDTLSGYNKAAKEMTPLMNWVNANLNTRDLSLTEIVSPELIITMSISKINSNYILGISTLSDGEYVETDTEVKTINLAVLTSNTYMILPAVTEFNKTNSKYQINVETYTLDEYTPDFERFEATLASGKIPDVIFSNILPVRDYINKGMIADLYEFIDNDTDLSRDDFIKSALLSGELNGKLYQLPLQFSVFTLYGKKSNIGDINGWTYAEFKEKWDALPDGTMMSDEIARDVLILYFSLYDLNNFTDYEKGICDFDNPEFIEAMRVISSFPQRAPRYDIKSEDFTEYFNGLYSEYKNNTMYLGYTFIASIETAITQLRKFDYEAVSFPGNPTVSGKNGTRLSTYDIVITEQSKVKDGAWEFVKYLLSDDIQSHRGLNMNFAVTKSALKLQFDHYNKTITDNSDYRYIDERTGLLNSSNTPLTPEDRLRNGYLEFSIPEDLYDIVLEMLNNTNSNSITDGTLSNIVVDEMFEFWGGRGTLEETAKIIQNRASVYMSEIN